MGYESPTLAAFESDMIFGCVVVSAIMLAIVLSMRRKSLPQGEPAGVLAAAIVYPLKSGRAIKLPAAQVDLAAGGFGTFLSGLCMQWAGMYITVSHSHDHTTHRRR